MHSSSALLVFVIALQTCFTMIKHCLQQRNVSSNALIVLLFNLSCWVTISSLNSFSSTSIFSFLYSFVISLNSMKYNLPKIKLETLPV